MKTSEAIKFFQEQPFTDPWGFNVLTEDLLTIPVIDQEVFEDKLEEKSISSPMQTWRDQKCRR